MSRPQVDLAAAREMVASALEPDGRGLGTPSFAGVGDAIVLKSVRVASDDESGLRDLCARDQARRTRGLTPPTGRSSMPPTSQPTSCPNSTESGCRCPQHHPGLSAYAPDPDAYDQAIAPHREVRLRVVTAGLGDEPQCDGSMTCSCKRCLAAKAERVRQGASGGGRHQPWRPRPPRRRAAA